MNDFIIFLTGAGVAYLCCAFIMGFIEGLKK